MLPTPIDHWIRSWPEWLKTPLHAFRLLAQGMLRQAQWPFIAFLLQIGTLIANAVSAKCERECLACGWTGWRFLPDWSMDKIVQDTLCPRCGSFSRYHLYFWWLRQFLNMQPGELLRIRILEVAPKPCSIRFFRQSVCNGGYHSCDLTSSLAMSKQDITYLGYRDKVFDLVLCSHVLEHVFKDVIGISELYRVTRHGGVGLIQVPVDWNLTKSQEYSKPKPEEDSHVRRYGQDYLQRLESVGFRIEVFYMNEQMDVATQLRYGIKPERLVIAYKD